MIHEFLKLLKEFYFFMIYLFSVILLYNLLIQKLLCSSLFLLKLLLIKKVESFKGSGDLILLKKLFSLDYKYDFLLFSLSVKLDFLSIFFIENY